MLKDGGLFCVTVLKILWLNYRLSLKQDGIKQIGDDAVNVHSVYTIDRVTYKGDITDCELCEEPLSVTEMLLLGWRKRSRYLFLTFCPDKPQSMELDIRAAKNGTPYSTHIVLE